MSRYERLGTRDLTFSNWHRQLSDRVTMIDLDALEYCRRCRMPLALIETAYDKGQEKATIVLERLAQTANVPAFCVLWTPSDDQCLTPGQKCDVAGCAHGIAAFRFRRVFPDRTGWTQTEPKHFGAWLTRLHDSHELTVCAAIPGAVA